MRLAFLLDAHTDKRRPAVALSFIVLVGAAELVAVGYYYAARTHAAYKLTQPATSTMPSALPSAEEPATVTVPETSAEPTGGDASRCFGGRSFVAPGAKTSRAWRHHHGARSLAGSGAKRTEKRQRSRGDGDDLRIDPALRSIE